MTGSFFCLGVEQLLNRPGLSWRNQSGALAAVQHSGNTGEDQAGGGSTVDGVRCIESWVGAEKWDVITIK